ncbi:hypothetical protein DQC29_21775 [Salmonella enterica subsp. enterica serovar Telelkebir]|nr:hypothetical protein [Salmonella enterica subsp. enterica serovar Telelkebir]ELT8232546.1 hypothetical protein [Salmonella enterica]
MKIKVEVTLLAILFVSFAATAGAKNTIKTVSLNDFTGDDQALMVRDIENKCDYHATITKTEKDVKWHGVTQPQYRWDVVVDRKKCGSVIEQVNMQIVPDGAINTLPIKAGSVYYIYPNWDAFSQK